MYAIAGVSGHVGSVAAKELIAQRKQVKVLVRDAHKGADWSHRGAEVAVGALEDDGFLTTAFKGTEGVFVLLPWNLASTDILADQKTIIAAVAKAVQAAKVPHVVLLSSIGADLSEGTGPVTGLYFFEEALRATATKLTAIRAGTFQENVFQSLAPARQAGIYPNFSPSREIATPMIATKDIGYLVTESLASPSGKSEIIDLHGPAYTVMQVAQKLGAALGKTLDVVDIPPADWFAALTQAGLSPAWARAAVEINQAFSSGRVTPKGDRLVHGKTEIDEVIKQAVHS